MMAQMWKLYSETEIKIDLQRRARFRKVTHFDIVATKDPCSTFGEWEECQYFKFSAEIFVEEGSSQSW